MGIFGNHSEKKEWEIIDSLLEDNKLLIRIVKFLLPKEHPCHEKAKHLSSIYNLVTPSGDIAFVNNKKSKMATITVLDGQNNVPGQLIPLALDGVTKEPITTINAGSEVYTSSDATIATVAPVTGGPEGSFLVTRVAGKSGNVTISYTAVNTAGTTILGSDSFIFQGPPTGVAASLTASYGTPTA